MASTLIRNDFSEKRNELAADAGLALERLFAGPHRDKRIAQAFGITVRMAQYLRQGKHWTHERFLQLAALQDAAPPEQTLEDRLNELERELATLRRLLRIGRGWE
jgi:hypothetical protein